MMGRVGAYERQQDDIGEENETAMAPSMLGQYMPQWKWKPSYLIYILLAIAYLLIIILFGIVASKVPPPAAHLNKSDIKPMPQQDNGMALCDSSSTQWVQFNGKCYYFSPEKATWMRANRKCEEKHSRLVIIKSMAEQNFLHSRTNNQRYWIGLSDRNFEGEWKWMDGSDSQNGFTYWGEGEPNDNSDGEDCAHLWMNGQWNDVYCTYPCNYICEKPAQL
nr:hepatic lectin-like [Anolis sagrei ordinatus]